jgi:hypothetical protein
MFIAGPVRKLHGIVHVIRMVHVGARSVMRLVEYWCRLLPFAVALRLPMPNTEAIFQVALDPHLADNILLEREVDCRGELWNMSAACLAILP